MAATRRRFLGVLIGLAVGLGIQPKAAAKRRRRIYPATTLYPGPDLYPMRG